LSDEIAVQIVEDDPVERRLLHQILTSMRFTVFAADSLGMALETIDEADILILDLHLNGDGAVLLQHWVEQRKGPALVLSAYLDREQINQHLAHGAWNVLQKHVPGDTIRAIMQKYREVIMTYRECAENKIEIQALHKRVSRIRYLVVVLAILAAGAGVGGESLIAMLKGWW